MGDDFHDKHAKYPSPQDMDPAKEHAEEIAGIIFHFLQERGMVEWYEESNSRMFIEQGSSYEGTKTETTDLEFDLLFLLPSSLKIIPDDSDTPAGYAYLEFDDSIRGKSTFLNECNKKSEGGFISISEVMDVIMKTIKGIQHELPPNVKAPFPHGPALQFDVKNPATGQFWFSVDVAFGIRIENTTSSFISVSDFEAIFVPNPQYQQSYESQFEWRQSFLVEELLMVSYSELKFLNCNKLWRPRNNISGFRFYILG